MRHLIAKIKQLYVDNALHRKGRYIRDETISTALAHTVNELGELLLEVADWSNPQSRSEDYGTAGFNRMKTEYADVLAVVLHLGILIQYRDTLHSAKLSDYWDLQDLELLAVDKLNQRYTP